MSYLWTNAGKSTRLAALDIIRAKLDGDNYSLTELVPATSFYLDLLELLDLLLLLPRNTGTSRLKQSIRLSCLLFMLYSIYL